MCPLCASTIALIAGGGASALAAVLAAITPRSNKEESDARASDGKP